MTNLQETSQEIWKDVLKYEGLYQVSSLSRIRRLSKTTPPRILKPFSDGRKGYLQIALCRNNTKKTAKVHRIVAIAFVHNPRPELYTQTNHINGIKTDNRIENIEWVSPSVNTKHAYIMGLITKKMKAHGQKLDKNQPGQTTDEPTIYCKSYIPNYKELLDEANGKFESLPPHWK